MNKLEELLEQIKNNAKQIYGTAEDHLGDIHAVLIHQLGTLYLETKEKKGEKKWKQIK